MTHSPSVVGLVVRAEVGEPIFAHESTFLGKGVWRLSQQAWRASVELPARALARRWSSHM